MGTFTNLMVKSGLLGAVMRQGPAPVIVLGYHDLSADGDYSSWLKVPVSVFEDQIRFLGEVGTFIRPDDLFEPDRLSRSRPNLLLSFDDGFAGNYRYAFPVIMKYRVPALFFVSTWNMETGEPFWFDRIIRLIQEYNLECLDLGHAGMKIYPFQGTGGAGRWNGIQELLEDIKRVGRDGFGDRVEVVIGALEQACGVRESSLCRERCRPLTREQIREMHKSGLCHFGSHSHRHEILTCLDDESLARELRVSREILEDLVGGPVLHLSYPNGDSDPQVRQACRETGYRFGYTTAAGGANGGTDPMEIPRILVGGYDSTVGLIWKLGRVLMKAKRAGSHG